MQSLSTVMFLFWYKQDFAFHLHNCVGENSLLASNREWVAEKNCTLRVCHQAHQFLATSTRPRLWHRVSYLLLQMLTYIGFTAANVVHTPPLLIVSELVSPWQQRSANKQVMAIDFATEVSDIFNSLMSEQFRGVQLIEFVHWIMPYGYGSTCPFCQ